jgi:hypothetical protein
MHTRSDADSIPGVPHRAVIIGVMADKSAGSRPPRQRIKTLTLMKRLVTRVAPVEAIVEHIDYMVGVGETVISPFSVTEHTVRNVVNAVRDRTRR